MNLLAIDTAANLCAACVWDAGAGVERGRSVADLGKGHAEYLMTTIDAALEAAGCGYGDLGMLAVATGAGSVTGVRVGGATARGLAAAARATPSRRRRGRRSPAAGCSRSPTRVARNCTSPFTMNWQNSPMVLW